MFKLIKRIIILVFAAWLGSYVYTRIQSVSEVVDNLSPTDTAADEGDEDNDRTSRRKPHYFQGGIGPVGNPHDTDTRRTRNLSTY